MYIFDRDANGNPIFKSSAFGFDDGMRFRGLGISGTATAGTVTNIDHTLTEERYLSGVRLLLKDHAFGDKANLEVVHPTAGVLDRFAESWFFDPDICTQPDAIRNYPAKLPAGLIIRIAYESVGVTDVSVKANYFLDWKGTP